MLGQTKQSRMIATGAEGGTYKAGLRAVGVQEGMGCPRKVQLGMWEAAGAQEEGLAVRWGFRPAEA